MTQETLSGTTTAGLLSTLGAGTALVAVIWYILQVIARWKIFTKANEAGWKSLIPIYNEYILYKISWRTMFFWLLLLFGLIGSFFSGTNNAALQSINAIFMIVAGIIEIIAFHMLSKSFGHGLPFTLGLIFLNPLFMLILALGKSTYTGHPDNR